MTDCSINMKINAQFFTLRLGPTDPEILKKLIDTTADSGMNMICLELEKGIQYESHPEISASWALDKKTIKGIVDHIRDRGLIPVPKVPLFSHSEYILEKHPEFREPDSKVYCTSSPGLYPLIFELLEEVIDLFKPVYLHIGHDEALSSYDPRKRTRITTCDKCVKKKSHNVFKDDIIQLHDFLSEKNIRTMMWADCLLKPDDFKDSCFYQSGVYGGPPDNLHLAIDSLPKDIIMCDWHYEPAREFPTVRFLQDKGFETLGCPLFEINSYLFTRYAHTHKTKFLKGMMATSWCHINKTNFRILNPVIRKHGFHFSNPGIIPKSSEVLKKVSRTCDQWGNVLKNGQKKVFDFSITGNGAFHSSGWRDLRYMEWPRCHDPINGPRYPDSLELKSTRYGTVDYLFKASSKKGFDTVRLKVWMSNLGKNAIEVSTNSDNRFKSVIENKDLKGNTLDISNLVQGADQFILRFSGENNTKDKCALLKRFEVITTKIGAKE